MWVKKEFYYLLGFMAIYSCTHIKDDTTIINPPSSSINWEYADSLRSEIKEALIPSDTFYIEGIIETPSPQQIQEAINIVSNRGGGTLILSKGIYASGAITMKSRVELHLDEGAIIKFLPNTDLYPLKYIWFNGTPCLNFSSMIYAKNESDIKISGKGVIDGQGNNPVWKNMKFNEKVDRELLSELDSKKIKLENREFGKGHCLRPNLISFYECSRITITGVSIINTPLYALHPVMSKDITITNASIKSKGYDQIGIAIESSQNILINSMQIEEIGEGIKLLSGRVEIPNNMAASNIIIQNSSFKNVTYTPIIFSSKSIEGINRVFLSTLQMEGSERGVCIYGQQDVEINDVFIKDVVAKEISGSFLYTRILRTNNTSPIIFNIQLDSIKTTKCGRAFIMLGNSKNPIQNINIKNSFFSVSKGSFAKHLMQFNLKNVDINEILFNNNYNIGFNKTHKIYLDGSEGEILESDDIQYNSLPIAVKNRLEENYAYVPINDIDRMITSSNVIYDIDLELESFQRIVILVQEDGKIIRTENKTSYDRLPAKVTNELEHYLGTSPKPYLFNEIKEIHYNDFTYYELKGEYNKKLFALGISKDGKVIEKKQQTITSYFPYN